VPFASVGLWKLPDEVSDEQAIMLSDIFPTGYYGAEIAEIAPGDAVAVFGCGPVGQFAIASARLLDAGRIFAVDTIPSRLEMARAQGAEVIDFNAEAPVETIRRLTGGIGVDRVIEAASGDAPSQALQWAVDAADKAGTIAILGVYPPSANVFPIGKAMMRNLTINMGNCPHRRYVPKLVELIASGVLDPTMVLTNRAPMTSAIEAYASFDQRQPGWVKVMLQMAEPARAAA
jgi:threonine dehydrogenase-like Zn-dependent dehydrogenase